MVRAKALTEGRLAGLWRAVKEQDSDSFWDELRAEQLLTVKRIIEAALEQEMIAHLCARRYERSSRHCGRRNGYYRRSILRVSKAVARLGADLEALLAFLDCPGMACGGCALPMPSSAPSGRYAGGPGR